MGTIQATPVIEHVADTAPPNPGGCEQYRPLLAQYNWDVTIAIAVMEEESTQDGIPCNSNADNTGLNLDGTNDKGLMQVNSIHVASGLIGDAERLNPELNIKAAYSIYLGSGWRAWSSYNSGAYQKHL